jgi:hypothetical protein
VSKRPHFTTRDLDLVSGEFPDDEAVEALVVSATVISQEPEGLLLAHNEAAGAVGAVVNTGGIATERNVVGELVDLIAKSESSTIPWCQYQSIRCGLAGCGSTYSISKKPLRMVAHAPALHACADG